MNTEHEQDVETVKTALLVETETCRPYDAFRRILARLEKAEGLLREAVDPLDLYNAYGWPDRDGVRRKIRAFLPAPPKQTEV